MSTHISDAVAWKRLRIAIGSMVLGAFCLVGVVQVVMAL
jgi:hypothetical protein